MFNVTHSKLSITENNSKCKIMLKCKKRNIPWIAILIAFSVSIE